MSRKTDDIDLMLTNGGRSLKAIWNNPQLNATEKIVLLYLGSEADFTGTFTEFRYHRAKDIARNCSLTERSVFRVIKDLEDKGYVKRKQRKKDNQKLPSSFAIKKQLFDEYRSILEEKVAKGKTLQKPPKPPPKKEPVAEKNPCETRETFTGGTDTVSVGVVTQDQYPTDTVSDLPPSKRSPYIDPPTFFTPDESGTADGDAPPTVEKKKPTQKRSVSTPEEQLAEDIVATFGKVPTNNQGKPVYGDYALKRGMKRVLLEYTQHDLSRLSGFFRWLTHREAKIRIDDTKAWADEYELFFEHHCMS